MLSWARSVAYYRDNLVKEFLRVLIGTLPGLVGRRTNPRDFGFSALLRRYQYYRASTYKNIIKNNSAQLYRVYRRKHNKAGPVIPQDSPMFLIEEIEENLRFFVKHLKVAAKPDQSAQWLNDSLKIASLPKVAAYPGTICILVYFELRPSRSLLPRISVSNIASVYDQEWRNN